jgi:hypothetical protein
LDGSGSGVLGTVDDDLMNIRTSPYILCEKCDQIPWKHEQEQTRLRAAF